MQNGKNSYKRQIEIYQWLLKNNGFKVSDTSYFIYCNGKKDREQFGGKLEFDIHVLPYLRKKQIGLSQLLEEILVCLKSDTIPDPSSDCKICEYRKKHAFQTAYSHLILH